MKKGISLGIVCCILLTLFSGTGTVFAEAPFDPILATSTITEHSFQTEEDSDNADGAVEALTGITCGTKLYYNLSLGEASASGLTMRLKIYNGAPENYTIKAYLVGSESETELGTYIAYLYRGSQYSGEYFIPFSQSITGDVTIALEFGPGILDAYTIGFSTFTLVDASLKVDAYAENYRLTQQIAGPDIPEVVDGPYLQYGFFADGGGDYIITPNVDFGTDEAKAVMFQIVPYAAPTEDSVIEIRIDGPCGELIGKLEQAELNNLQIGQWQYYLCLLDKGVTGVQNICFTGNNYNTSFRSFRFHSIKDGYERLMSAEADIINGAYGNPPEEHRDGFEETVGWFGVEGGESITHTLVDFGDEGATSLEVRFRHWGGAMTNVNGIEIYDGSPSGTLLAAIPHEDLITSFKTYRIYFDEAITGVHDICVVGYSEGALAWIQFGKETRPLYVSHAAITDETGKDLIGLSEAEGMVTATYTVEDYVTGTQQACAVISIYDQDGKLQKVNYEDKEIVGRDTISVSIDPTGYQTESYQLGVMLLESLSTMRPLTYQTLTDPFEKYKYMIPEIVEVLDEGTEYKSTILKKVKFRSRSYKGMDDIVYAVIAYPLDYQTSGKTYPGILQVHGGGGCAEFESACAWARNGYVSVALDVPSIANPSDDVTPHSEGYWKTLPYGSEMFQSEKGAESSLLFGAVTAELLAFNLLASDEYVDSEHIGITGGSWGGYSTTMLGGLLGDRVQALFSYFGCGFYDDGTVFDGELNKISAEDKAEWLKYLDAGRRAHRITAPYLNASGTNDTFFHPPAVIKTMETIPGETYMVFSPNTDHNVNNAPDTARLMYEYMDYYLKGTGLRMMTVKIDSFVVEDDGSRTVRFTADSAGTVTSAKIWYSTTGEWGPNGRTWLELSVEDLGNGVYEGNIPAELVEQNAYWYVLVQDNRSTTGDAPSCMSSLIYYSNTDVLETIK